MGRPLRQTPGGYIYHALNRANARLPIFHKEADYEAFERILLTALERIPGMRLLDYCLMPNHWHFVLWPRGDTDLSAFIYWLTLTHSQRWKAHYREIGSGHLYQGRFKSFPVQDDDHFLTVCRYVERNASRAGLVTRAEDWRWGSLWHRCDGTTPLAVELCPWPIDEPKGWLRWVNTPQSEAELEDIRVSVNRGRPYGSLDWQDTTVKRLGLEITTRKRGRPAKKKEKGS